MSKTMNNYNLPLDLLPQDPKKYTKALLYEKIKAYFDYYEYIQRFAALTERRKDVLGMNYQYAINIWCNMGFEIYFIAWRADLLETPLIVDDKTFIIKKQDFPCQMGGINNSRYSVRIESAFAVDLNPPPPSPCL